MADYGSWIGPAVMAAGTIGGALIGKGAASSDFEAERAAYEQSVKDLEAIGVPSVEAQQMTMERYRSAGKLTPELEEAIQLGDSQMGGIALDPANKEAQMAALMKLKEVGSQGGMTLSDRAAMETTMGNIDADVRGNREAGLSRMRSRGQLGSGLELAAQQGASQQDVTARHLAGLTAQGSAQDRALQAIMQGGQLGGQMRSQEFSEKQSAAQAQDAIAKWNAANTQGVRTANTNRSNSAQEYNLTGAQRISDANTEVANKEQAYNTGLQQQKFQNDLAVNTAKANARAKQGSALGISGQKTADMWAGIGAGVGQAGAQYMNDQSSAEERELRRKELLAAGR